MKGNKVSLGPFNMPMKDNDGDIVINKDKPFTRVTSDKKGMA